MRVLVTGGAGFLGRHVVARLVADGFQVTVFDQQPVAMPGVTSRTGDLADLADVAEAAAGQDAICHIGAVGDVYLAASDPPLAARVNVLGTANVAEAARRAGARVVYASTWEVYGDPVYEPIDEEHPCAPDHPYSITKLAGERMLLAADHLQDVPVVALRLGTAFGTGLRPNAVIRLFIDRAAQGKPITILGDGAQARQFTHAADIARAFSLAARSDVRRVVLNTVASEPVSIKQLADLVVERYPTELVFGPPRPGDVPPAIVSSEKITRVLGWQPHVSFSAGLTELMDSVAEA